MTPTKLIEAWRRHANTLAAAGFAQRASDFTVCAYALEECLTSLVVQTKDLETLGRRVKELEDELADEKKEHRITAGALGLANDRNQRMAAHVQQDVINARLLLSNFGERVEPLHRPWWEELKEALELVFDREAAVPDLSALDKLLVYWAECEEQTATPLRAGMWSVCREELRAALAQVRASQPKGEAR